MTIKQNVARGKAVTEYIELGESICRDEGHEPGAFWTAVAVGAADRAGIAREVDFLPKKTTRKRTRLNDDSTLPFGKHGGERLGDVPDDYWRWFLSQDWCDSWPDLVEYANVLVEN